MSTFQTLQAPSQRRLPAPSASASNTASRLLRRRPRPPRRGAASVDDPVAARGQEWALQLWPANAFDGHPRAQRQDRRSAGGGLGDSGSTWFSASTDVFPPAGRADHNLVLILAAGQAGRFEQVQDYVNFPAPRALHAAAPGRHQRFSLADDKVTVTVERVGNPRSQDNLSGTLALELWAQPAPYRRRTDGWQLSATALGSSGWPAGLAGPVLHPAPRHRPAGTCIALLLREWSANGYVTRDFSNFPLPVSWSAEAGCGLADRKRCRRSRTCGRAGYRQARHQGEAGCQASAMAAVAAPASVSINTATAAELAAVKGLQGRRRYRGRPPFKSLDELIKVKGMGVKSSTSSRATQPSEPSPMRPH